MRGPCQADFENAEDVFGLAASTDPVLPADFEALGALIAARLKIYEGSAHYVAMIKVLLKESCSELKVRCSHRPQSIAIGLSFRVRPKCASRQDRSHNNNSRRLGAR